MPIESLLFADAAINLCIFLTVQAAFGCANIKGLSQALLLSMFNALVFHLINPPFWRTLPIQACFCFSYGAMLARHKSFRHTAAVSAAVLSVTSAAAGFTVLCDSALLPILAGLVFTGFLLHRSRCACRRWNVEVIIEKNGVYYRKCKLGLY